MEDDIFHEGRHSNIDDIFHEGRHSNMDDIFHEGRHSNMDDIFHEGRHVAVFVLMIAIVCVLLYVHPWLLKYDCQHFRYTQSLIDTFILAFCILMWQHSL